MFSIDLLENMMVKVCYILLVVVFFNFEVNVVDKGFGCLFFGFIVVIKEFFFFVLVFVFIVYVFIIYSFYLVVNLILWRGKLLFVYYVVVVVEILLLGYDCFVEIFFKLMYCVFVGFVWCFYFDGNIVCW